MELRIWSGLELRTPGPKMRRKPLNQWNPRPKWR
jgi:hypothetical protein